jgi:hypothetical protein
MDFAHRKDVGHSHGDDPPVQDGAPTPHCFGEVRLSHALAKRPAAGPGHTRPARREELRGEPLPAGAGVEQAARTGREVEVEQRLGGERASDSESPTGSRCRPSPRIKQHFQGI